MSSAVSYIEPEEKESEEESVIKCLKWEGRKNIDYKPERKAEEVVVCPKPLETSPLPPQPLLPPVHPPLALKKAEEKRKLASVEFIIKRIRAQRDDGDKRQAWNTIREKKAKLQELFTTSEKSINENRASMARFYEIIKEAVKVKKILELELDCTEDQIDEYKKIEDEFKHYVEKYSIFERFLESVAGVGENWRNVRDVLNRYETLQSTSLECVRILEEELNESADLRKRMLTLMAEKSNYLKTLNNKLILLEVQRKDSRDNRIYWEHMVQRIKNFALDKEIEATSLKAGINDLYISICNRLRVVASIPPIKYQEQIEFIHKGIMFFKEVVIIASGIKNTQGAKQSIENKIKASMIRNTK